ncbi:MAG: hypothetical protein SNJ72_02690 [Fimbriimonadales bacterium]
MARFKDGDRVRVKAREVQGKEAHEGRYAPHLANTIGTILKFYSPQEVAVDLDIDSLPESIRDRHAQQQSAMHEKWLGSLSEEARNRLTDEEKQFRLRYVVLLTESDLEPLKGAPTKRPTEKPAAEKTEPSQSKRATANPSPSQTPTRQRAPQAFEAPARPTPEQLEQMEQEYLQQRQKTSRKK